MESYEVVFLDEVASAPAHARGKRVQFLCRCVSSPTPCCASGVNASAARGPRSTFPVSRPLSSSAAMLRDRVAALHLLDDALVVTDASSTASAADTLVDVSAQRPFHGAVGSAWNIFGTLTHPFDASEARLVSREDDDATNGRGWLARA